jgi:hypothetical protein
MDNLLEFTKGYRGVFQCKKHVWTPISNGIKDISEEKKQIAKEMAEGLKK